MKKLNEKVYKFVTERKDVLRAEDVYLLVNDKLLELNGTKVKASDVFVKMKVYTNMITGWSPLQNLELNDDGQLVSDKARICFVDKDGEQIRVKKIRNTIIQMSDKDSTKEVDDVFDVIGNKDPFDDNEKVGKLKGEDYVGVKNGEYVFMYKDGSEPYLFMRNADESIMTLGLTEVYNNEDSVKYKIDGTDRELAFDVKGKAITVN